MVKDTSLGYQSTKSFDFRNTVKKWLSERPEVLAMFRFSHAGGAKSFEFFSSYDSFEKRLDEQKPMTCVIVFYEPQLPLRGIVDESYIEKALAMVPDGEEYLLAGLELTTYGSVSYFDESSGNNHVDMKESLHDRLGSMMAFGPHPPWLYDSEVVISAVVPLSDGTVRCGIY